MSQHMRVWYISLKHPAKAQTRLPYAQSRQSLHCSHTEIMDVDIASDQTLLDSGACAIIK